MYILPHAHHHVWCPAADERQHNEDGHSERSGSGPAEMGRSGAQASRLGPEKPVLGLDKLDSIRNSEKLVKRLKRKLHFITPFDFNS